MAPNYVEDEVYRGDEFTGLQLSFFSSQMELHTRQSPHSFDIFECTQAPGRSSLSPSFDTIIV